MIVKRVKIVKMKLNEIHLYRNELWTLYTYDAKVNFENFFPLHLRRLFPPQYLNLNFIFLSYICVVFFRRKCFHKKQSARNAQNPAANTILIKKNSAFSFVWGFGRNKYHISVANLGWLYARHKIVLFL